MSGLHSFTTEHLCYNSLMNADAIRHFFNYHFAFNRFIWDNYISPLSLEQFNRPSA